MLIWQWRYVLVNGGDIRHMPACQGKVGVHTCLCKQARHWYCLMRTQAVQHAPGLRECWLPVDHAQAEGVVHS